jgi:hypothetical protein
MWLPHIEAKSDGLDIPDLLAVDKTMHTRDTRIKSSFLYPTTGGWRWWTCRRKILVFIFARYHLILLWDCTSLY